MLESQRKKGVANALLDAAEEYAIKTKVKGLKLSTAFDNHNAQRLYERLGYRKDEEYYHYFLSVVK